MSPRHTPIYVGWLVALNLLVGCQRDKPTPGALSDVQKEPAATPRLVIDPAFAERIHATAIDYFDYPRVDDKPHWAPGPCANTKMVEDAPRVQMSNAEAESLHKEKFYYLFVKNYQDYLKPGEGSAPVGQVLVKQAYLAEEVPKTHKESERLAVDDPRVVERSGRKYTLGDPLSLFIMIKLDEKTPNTDHGWIYGVTDFDGKVEAAGMIESCARCHAHAAHDRIFGGGAKK